MTREDWKKVETALCYPLAVAKLLVDGREISLQVRTDKMKMVVHVYVEGWVRGEWLDPKKPCPEQAFLRRNERYLWSKKHRDTEAKFAKRFGKSEAKKYLGDLDKKFTYFTPYFPSVRAIRTQYEKTFKTIELVTE